MFLDEITPEEVGFSKEQWGFLSLNDKRVVVAFFVRRTPIGAARALGVRESGISTIRRKIYKLDLVRRLAMLRVDKQVPAPQTNCQQKD